MKKTAVVCVLVAVVCLCAVFAGCGKSEGYWALKSIEGAGATTEEEIAAVEEAIGGVIYMWLKPDKTAEFNIIAGADSGTYTNKVVVINGDEMPYMIKGDKLYLAVDDGSTMIFERATEAAVKGYGG